MRQRRSQECNPIQPTDCFLRRSSRPRHGHPPNTQNPQALYLERGRREQTKRTSLYRPHRIKSSICILHSEPLTTPHVKLPALPACQSTLEPADVHELPMAYTNAYAPHRPRERHGMAIPSQVLKRAFTEPAVRGEQSPRNGQETAFHVYCTYKHLLARAIVYSTQLAGTSATNSATQYASIPSISRSSSGKGMLHYISTKKKDRYVRYIGSNTGCVLDNIDKVMKKKISGLIILSF